MRKKIVEQGALEVKLERGRTAVMVRTEGRAEVSSRSNMVSQVMQLKGLGGL